MKSNFRGYNRWLCLLSLAAFVVFVFAMRAHKMNGGEVSWAPFFVIIIPMFVGLNFPCSYSADYSGFEIRRFGIGSRFDYGSIENATHELLHRPTFDLVKLTVRGSFGEKTFYEVTYKGRMSSATGEPVYIRKPKLVQLCEYVQQAI